MGQEEVVIRRIAELLAEICRHSGLAVISEADLGRLEASAHPVTRLETLPPPSRVLVTVQQLCLRTPAFKEQTIRQLLLERHNNGLDKVVRHLGRRLLIDEEQFFSWIDERSGFMPLEISRSSDSRQPQYVGPINGRTA